ncbi:MAG: cobaltochelatase subunit CobN [Nitratireductor sp.]
MHLILAQKGQINEGNEAVDLGQSPGDILVLSAADTEIASLASACHELGGDGPSVRLANLMQLAHPMSVDTYAERTAIHARMIVVRVLGGAGYWPYGLEKLYTLAVEHDIAMAVLPGDDKADPALSQYCTVAPNHCHMLHQYLVQGGPQNSANFLRYCHWLMGAAAEEPEAPSPLLKAGLWYPGKGICHPSDLPGAWVRNRPVVAICFYRALVQSGGLEPIAALVDALGNEGMNALPVFVSSLKDAVCVETLRGLFGETRPVVVINLTGFAVSAPGQPHGSSVLDEGGAVILQAVLAGNSLEAWQTSSQGLLARDLAMNVALPEIDGKVLTRAIAFKHAGTFDAVCETNIVAHQSVADRVGFVAELAANWARLRQTRPQERRIAIVLANYPNRDGRLGNGVGLDTPAGTAEILKRMDEEGYAIGSLPRQGQALIEHLMAGPTNSGNDGREIRAMLPLEDYAAYFAGLSDNVRDGVTARWGKPEDDPYFLPEHGGFALPLDVAGNVAIGIQPARGYNIDPSESYHSPDLVPPHGYIAFYAYLRKVFDAQAVVHMGKHGNMEWLPGKALALSQDCYPEAVFGAMPHLYPFIVNDPGEGSQAKRRSAAVIIDHLTPPLTRAESYGPLRDLEALVDEYYDASGNDPRRVKLIGRQIVELVEDSGIDKDVGIVASDGESEKLTKLDAWLCELKELQIRDGLHVFGKAPEGRLLHDLATALVRLPRGDGEGGNASLQRTIAGACGFDLDPLDCNMAEPWAGARPDILAAVSTDPWRTSGDTVERIELLAASLVAGDVTCPEDWAEVGAVLQQVRDAVLPRLMACGPDELDGLMRGISGRFVAPGPSGAPTRGRPDVLPTGRNFYSVDCRAVPTPTAWELGKKSAELLITRYRQDHGEWPTSFGLSVWGTSNMRTGGDDIAQAMALIGVKPVWEHGSRRVTGYEVATLAELGRPRVDVTLRISGFFRDAFPAQIELFDKAIRAVGALDEDATDNPVGKRMREETSRLAADGLDLEEATRRAGYRIFGSKPGAYGAGLQALIDEKGWERKGDLAEAYLSWGSYAYGAVEEGVEDRESFRGRLSTLEAVIHNQDNREHDLLDSDDYYQFEGGMTAAVEHVSGAMPSVYHNDHSRPEKPVIRALDEEIARIVRGRCANPKWIAGVMRHGYKGAFEMAATLDYMFAFAATTGAVRSHHFDLVHDAWLGNEAVLEFIRENNPAALKEMAERFVEAEQRGLWTPRSNSAMFDLERLTSGDAK